MDGSLITIALAVLAVVLAWKFLKGLVKTVALVAILVMASLVVFGGGLG